MQTKPESSFLLHTRKTPQPQRQTLPQSKGLGKDFPIKWIKKEVGGAILVSNKIVFKLKPIKRDE